MAVAYMGHAVGGPAAGKWFRSFTRELVISEKAKDLSLQLAPAEVKRECWVRHTYHYVEVPGDDGFWVHESVRQPAQYLSLLLSTYVGVYS